MNLHESHGVFMMPNICDFLPFFDEFFPLLNMFANEAASEGFSATISATFMIPARVSIQSTKQPQISHNVYTSLTLVFICGPKRYHREQLGRGSERGYITVTEH